MAAYGPHLRTVNQPDNQTTMPIPSASTQNTVPHQPERNYFIPLTLVTSLFFLWGLAYGLLDVLNKHFQESLNITKTRSTLLQAAYFGAYFLVAMPAGIFMSRFGYKKGIIAGLLLYAVGAFLFYPAAQLQSFDFFLLSLFILAAGLTCLETAANPYVTVLGRADTAAFRLNMSQCFNGVGSFIGPIIAANLFFAESSGTTGNDLGSVKIVYVVIGAVVLLIAGLFVKTDLPEIREAETTAGSAIGTKKIWQHRHLVNAVITQFFYVAAQVGMAALFINYCTEATSAIDNTKASYLLSISLLLFTQGRFAGTALMRRIAPSTLLTLYAIINIALCVVVWKAGGWTGVYALMANFFFASIMFPTIFALGVKDLGVHTKQGSSLIIMSIVGGAIVPYVMGLLSEKSTAESYIIPLLCYGVVAWFGWRGYKVKDSSQ
jgi:FHS family L-fucose permease-like MFS transporter